MHRFLRSFPHMQPSKTTTFPNVCHSPHSPTSHVSTRPRRSQPRTSSNPQPPSPNQRESSGHYIDEKKTPADQQSSMPPRRYSLRWNEDAVHSDTVRAFLSELIASAIFVFASEGSVVSLGKLHKETSSAGGLVAVALANALAFTAAVALSLNISGGNVNPAVTMGALVGGRISLLRAVYYWIAQILGAVVASLLVRISTGGLRPVGLAVTAGEGQLSALLLEMVMTFGVVYAAYATAIDPRRGVLGTIAPLAVGLIVGANVLVGGPFDGAAMNPARAFGPALVGWRWRHHWIFWVGPLLGGALAGLVYEFLIIPAESPHPHHQPLAPEDY